MVAGVDELDPAWESAQQAIAWKTAVDPITAGISLAFCVIAQALFYIFPRLRQFPRSILSWVNLYNLTYMICMIMKWSPYSALHQSWVVHLVLDSLICKAGIVMDTAGLIGPTCCTLLLCLTLFLQVVLRIDVAKNKIYYWAYFFFAFIYPTGMAFIALYAFPLDSAFAVCILSGGALAIRITNLVLFLFQVVLFAATMLYVKRAFTAANRNCTTDNNFPISYLVIRFTAMFLSQLYGILPTQVAIVFLAPSIKNNAIFNRVSSITRLTGPVLDAAVLILGNNDFIDWVKAHYKARFVKKPLLLPEKTTTIEVADKVQVEIEMAEAGTSELLDFASSPAKTGYKLAAKDSGKTSLEEQESSDVLEGI